MESSDLEQVLRRRPIPRGQITLLKYLYEREGELVPASELVERIRWGDQDQFRGVLGAFGNRINYTDGILGQPGTDAFLQRERINEEVHYQLRSEARAAIEEVSALMTKFTEPMSVLLEDGTQVTADELKE